MCALGKMRSYKVALVSVACVVLVWAMYSHHSVRSQLRAAEMQTEGYQEKYRSSRNEAQGDKCNDFFHIYIVVSVCMR